jgi:hypothetical protein
MIAGTVGAMVTMMIHPTGHDLLASPDSVDRVAAVTAGVHALAIFTTGVTLIGCTGLSRRIGVLRPGVTAALTAYWIAAIAVISAATISGFVSPVVGKAMLAADPAGRPALQQLFFLSGALNQGFAKVYVLASALAIALWSVSLMRTRVLPVALAWGGFAVAALTLGAIGIGNLRLDVHGFGAVVFVEGVWMIAGGVLLLRNAGAGISTLESA